MSDNELDYSSPHFCPVFKEEISADICYECIMALTRTIKVSAVPELNVIENIEEARNTCSTCPYSDLE